jgi:predicted phage terminase large subunit-like protein
MPTIKLPESMSHVEIGPDDVVIAPQPGPQTQFLKSKADITIYGGAAGGGKTRGTLMFAAKHAAIQPSKGFRAVIFRRTFSLITQPGSIWDESYQIYPYLGGRPTQSKSLSWVWDEHDTEITFAHMQHHPKDTYAKKGLQAELIAFEELTEFEQEQFFYMISRNRSRSGVKPQMIATTNPEYDSWVRIILAPWVDPDYERPAKSGEIRYFVQEDTENITIRWLDEGETDPKAISMTFIASSLEDNPALMEKDPDYARRLEALPLVERLKLKYGDWFARKTGGKVYPRGAFRIIKVPPTDIVATVRRWDLAGTEDPRKDAKDKMRGGPDYTAGVLIGKTSRNSFVVLHAVWERFNEMKVYELLRNTASQDGQHVAIRIEQEPGGSGKRDIAYIRREVLFAYDFMGVPSEGNKLERSRIPASHVQSGNVEVLEGPWTEGFLDFMESFPNPKIHDDIPDAFNGGIKDLLDMNGSGGVVTLDSLDKDGEFNPFW